MHLAVQSREVMIEVHRWCFEVILIGIFMEKYLSIGKRSRAGKGSSLRFSM
jgi:hypothetical protein